MNKKACLFIVMFTLLLMTACGQSTDDSVLHSNTTAPEDADAVALYKKLCISCHAADLSGRVGPGLQQIGSVLTKEDLFELIHDGAKGMPAFKKILNDEEIEALAQWLSINK